MYVYLGSSKYTEGQPKDWVNSVLYWNMPGRPELRGMRQGYGVLEVARLYKSTFSQKWINKILIFKKLTNLNITDR